MDGDRVVLSDVRAASVGLCLTAESNSDRVPTMHTGAQVVDERGWVADKDVRALLDAGSTPPKVLDILHGAALKMLSDYLNPPRVLRWTRRSPRTPWTAVSAR